MDKLKILIRYHAPDMPKIEKIKVGDWIDLRAAEDAEMKHGEFRIISLGVSMKLPDGYEAHIVPRSSTFKNFRVMQANSYGVIDNAYSGDKDIWGFPCYAFEDTVIHKGDRICQFRIVKRMEPVEFEAVEHMPDASRGGFGSTGIQ